MKSQAADREFLIFMAVRVRGSRYTTDSSLGARVAKEFAGPPMPITGARGGKRAQYGLPLAETKLGRGMNHAVAVGVEGGSVLAAARDVPTPNTGGSIIVLSARWG